MMKMKPNTGILIGLTLLVSLFLACAKTANIQPEVKEPEVKEPRAIIYGDGVDIKGEVYLSDIVYSGGNFWSQGVPEQLEQWMNERTKVNVRFMPQLTAMKSIYLSSSPDAPPEQVYVDGLFKQPILLLSGGARPIHLTSAEQQNLRKYLVEQGGFLFIDDILSSIQFYESIHQMLEAVLPSYSIESIPNDHEIYHCYYQMGGPPAGSRAMYRPLEGIFIDGRLAVLINSMGYWDGFSGSSDHYAPGVLRFGVNLMIYAVTRGQIADRSAYNR